MKGYESLLYGCADSSSSPIPLPPCTTLPPFPPPTVVHVAAHWYNYERFAALYNLTDTTQGFAPLDSQPLPANITSPIAAIRVCFTTCKPRTHTPPRATSQLLQGPAHIAPLATARLRSTCQSITAREGLHAKPAQC